MIALLVMTDGRDDVLAETLASFAANEAGYRMRQQQSALQAGAEARDRGGSWGDVVGAYRADIQTHQRAGSANQQQYTERMVASGRYPSGSEKGAAHRAGVRLSMDQANTARAGAGSAGRSAPVGGGVSPLADARSAQTPQSDQGQTRPRSTFNREAFDQMRASILAKKKSDGPDDDQRS